MPQKVTDFNGGVALTSLQDGDIIYVIRSGTDQFADIEKLKDYLGADLVLDITIPSADVLTANTSPVTLVPAPGAGKVAIPVGPFFVAKVGGTTNYATNTSAIIRYASSDPITGIISLGVSSNQLFQTIGSNATGGDDYLVDVPTNSGIQFFVTGGNPTAGNKAVRIVGKYKIITL